MNNHLLGAAKIIRLLNSIAQQKGSGELIFTNSDSSSNTTGKKRQWKLYFFHGRLLYATSNLHRVRRWQRAIDLYTNTNDLLLQEMINEPWEYQLLKEGITKNKLTLHQAKTIIHNSVQEVLFDLASYQLPIASSWQFSKPLTSQIALLEPEQIFEKACNFWQHWQVQKLANISPNLAPICTQPYQFKNLEIENLASLLTGEHTIWDISFKKQTPLTKVAVCLLPLINKGKIELREIADFPLPIRRPNLTSDPPEIVHHQSKHQPLIACIDDSPFIGKTLEKILIRSGYRVLLITDPLVQMASLVKQKPDLIFLDLVMPDTNGYSLCTFLRKTPIFHHTPIIILSSQDSIVNRGHAKLTGASDFLSKPPEAEKVLQIVQKYLSKKTQEQEINYQIPSLMLAN